MRTFKQVVIILASVLMAFGCAKSTSQSAGPNVVANGGPVVPAVIIDPPNGSGSGGTTPVYSTGSTVAFTPVSMAVMNEYVATHPLNNPSNFKINVNLAQVQGGRYGGAVSIGYSDNGQQYNGEFKAGVGSNQSFKGMYDNGTLESEYNYWFKKNNSLNFSGFFEDQYGAITITLVPTGSSGGGNDGEPILAQSYKGYIYYKNFTVTSAPHSPYRSCWFTHMGPYDCRSNVIQTKCDLFPGAEAGYKLLGTFEGLSVKSAFNIN
ncbi:MAG: hypothetical protein H7Z71_09380 [Moraxellaceae bacterium]|nr:hypothetical protein [Pseudobdellovibrionaceae bacterium]